MVLTKDILDFLEIKFGIIGSKGPMEDTLKTLLQAAPTELSVLITGDTGTGKEVFANAIHGLSKRKNYTFVSVNCGAIPETLLESELFGHEKGAFTSADSQRKGFFETADKGTIFLDEIGEMPFGTQVKLLRILESGQFSRLGSSEVRRVNVRVIAATNRNLEDEVAKGNFRQDLYFRLKNVHLELPALSKHIEDIPDLYNFYAKKTAENLKLSVTEADPDTIEILKHQPWVGNIREFKNLIETVITLEKTTEITPTILRKYLRRELPPYSPSQNIETALVRKDEPNNANEMGLIFRSLIEIKQEISDLKHLYSNMNDNIQDIKDELTRKGLEYTIIDEGEKQDIPSSFSEMTIENMEKYMIQNALENFEGNRRKASNHLGISERTLYRKLTQFGLD